MAESESGTEEKPTLSVHCQGHSYLDSWYLLESRIVHLKDGGLEHLFPGFHPALVKDYF